MPYKNPIKQLVPELVCLEKPKSGNTIRGTAVIISWSPGMNIQQPVFQSLSE